MIQMLMGLGMGKRVAQGIAYVAIPLLILFVAWRLIDAYGDHRADQRETEVRADYKAASDRLKAEAENSATQADDRAAERLEEFQVQEQEERNRLDEAARNGSSPLDVLFGS